MPNTITRRELIAGLGAAGVASSRTASAFTATATAPVAPVAIARCKTYVPADLTPVLDGMFDKLGGLGKLVKGKTVAIKLNFNGGPTVRLGHLPLGDTHWPHPNLLAATMQLMARAGAFRIRLVEGAAAPRTDPFEEHMLDANWDPAMFLSVAPRVEFENTNYTNAAKKFTRMPVPHGGLLFPAYDLNHSYADCDVFVSIAKCKDHPTTGVSTVMKNLFGLTPLTAYGNGAGKLEDNDLVYGNDRIQILHWGSRQPTMGAPPEIDPKSPREDNYRVPRAIADLCAARPVHLAIVDGITSMSGGQTPTPWCTPVAPGFLIAGSNVVNTAAVGMAAMNYDPRAAKGSMPFDRCDNKLLLAEQLGVGSADLSRIEVVGASIQEAMFDFRTLREKQRASGADRMNRRRPLIWK
jgi:uncharacterized protein (DUF362 family)